MRRVLSLVCLLMSVWLVSCRSDETAPIDPIESDPRKLYHLEALPAHPTYPADNEKNVDRFNLGWKLFYDPVLSGTKDVACGTCHHARFAMGDARERSLGVLAQGLGVDRTATGSEINETARNSQTVINAAYYGTDATHSPLFWDGRVSSLEEQSLDPIRSPVEMLGHTIAKERGLDSILSRLRTYPLYDGYFRRAFPLEADSVANGWIPSAITASTLSRAIASFERELVTPNTRYDQYVRGNDTSLSVNEVRGLQVFFGKGGCGSCHSGPMLSDSRFYAQGAGQRGPGRDGFAGDDIGRMEQTNSQSDKYKFRTPTLRNIDRTAPYMHDGSIATLEEVIEYYNRGIASHTKVTTLDQSFKPLNLTTDEKQALLAFLHTLSDDYWEQFAIPPASVPSGLRVPR